MKVKIVCGVIPAILFSISASNVWADSMPTDCSTAKEDITKLEQEKKATSDKTVGGILGYSPIGLVTNVATGGDKMEEDEKMDAEEFNRKIDERIAEIKTSCSDALASEDSEG